MVPGGCGMVQEQGSRSWGMSSLEQEARLRRRLEDIPEFSAAGFRVEADRDGGSAVILRGLSCRGRWRAVDDGFVWIANNAGTGSRVVDDEDEAVRQTLMMVLTNLRVSLRRSRSPRPDKLPETPVAAPGVVATYVSPYLAGAGLRIRMQAR
jgi:hypothetical protein